MLKAALRYLKGQEGSWLFLTLAKDLEERRKLSFIDVETDSNWANDIIKRRSTTGVRSY